MSDLNKILDNSQFTSVDIEDFFGEDVPAEDMFSTDIIVLTDNEKELVNLLFKRLKKISPETLEGLAHRINDVERLAKDIARFPSLLHRQNFSHEIQTQQ